MGDWGGQSFRAAKSTRMPCVKAMTLTAERRVWYINEAPEELRMHADTVLRAINRGDLLSIGAAIALVEGIDRPPGAVTLQIVDLEEQEAYRSPTRA